MHPPGNRKNPGCRSASACTMSARSPPGRFFQRLEHRVLRLRVHQLGLLDDEHLSSIHRRLHADLHNQFRPNHVDRQVDPFALAGFVVIADQLLRDDVKVRMTVRFEKVARCAPATRRIFLRIVAKEQRPQRPRRGRFSHTQRPGEDHRVRKTIRGVRIPQRLDGLLLSDDVFERDHFRIFNVLNTS